MALNMTPELWRRLCEAAAAYPTCTLRLRQHEGWVRSFTVEHGPWSGEEPGGLPPRHVQPSLQPCDVSPLDKAKKIIG